MQIEDRGADLLDDGLQIIDAFGEPLSAPRRTACARDRSLQREPTANSRWITWSCRSRAIRSRSVSTSSSRMRRCVVASCQASAAWSANAAIMSSCSSLNGCRFRRRSATNTPATGRVVRSGSTSAGPALSSGADAQVEVVRIGAECARRKACPIRCPATGIGDAVAATAHIRAGRLSATTSSDDLGDGMSSSTGTATKCSLVRRSASVFRRR